MTKFFKNLVTFNQLSLNDQVSFIENLRTEETSSHLETFEGAQKSKRRRSHTHAFLFLYRLFSD